MGQLGIPTWAGLFQNSPHHLLFWCFLWLMSSRNQMLACVQVLQLKDLSFSKDVAWLFMFKCSTWLCIAKLVRDLENRPWIWEGFAENREHPRYLCWFSSWVGQAIRNTRVPAAICDWFRELVSWVVDNWEKTTFPGTLQWLDCLVWDKPGSAGTVGRGGLLASSLGSRRLGDVVLVASLLTVCRSWILERAIWLTPVPHLMVQMGKRAQHGASGEG